jgi:nitrite reductase (cytochrome c-552)
LNPSDIEMTTNPAISKRSARKRWLIAGVVLVAVATMVSTAVLISVFQHKQEAKNPFFRVVELDDETVDPAIWGRNFPLQYDGYRRTQEQVRTRYGGSEALPRTPTTADPRTVVSQSKVEADQRLRTLWSGYAFAVDFREERGHAFMLEDQTFTERQRVVKQPGTCLNCHASTYTVYKKLGGGDLFKGFEALNQQPYAEARKLVDHPVSCIDCHEPTTMALRVTRPAFIEGIRSYKALQGVANFDVNHDASRQEMRSYVCGQCHVEYYFKGPEKRLTYPWAKGLKADEILSYYDEGGFKDWTHKDTGAATLKAQHPEFEMYSQGIHARAGVSCADCHMPYQRVGAQKISDHHVQSPLLMINRACQACHRASEQEILGRVVEIQDRFSSTRDLGLASVVALIEDIKEAVDGGRTDEELQQPRNLQRQAQFLVDFVEAENSSGFHAPGEALRVLAKAIDLARQGQLALTDVTLESVPHE